MAAAMLEKIWRRQTENDSAWSTAVEINAPYARSLYSFYKQDFNLWVVQNNPLSYFLHQPWSLSRSDVSGVGYTLKKDVDNQRRTQRRMLNKVKEIWSLKNKIEIWNCFIWGTVLARHKRKNVLCESQEIWKVWIIAKSFEKFLYWLNQ